ncbi:ABC transporter substrate-binding protein [Myxococcota bacterium]
MAFGAASCGSNDTGNQRSESLSLDTQGQTIDLMTYWGNPGEAEAVQALIDVHKEAHPEDTIINSSYATGKMDPMYAERLAEGNPPDLVTVHTQTVSRLQNGGADSLRPMDDFLTSPSRADIVSQIYPELLTDAAVNDSVYVVPIGENRVNLFLYNKHVFKAQGLNPPTTVDELLTTCRKLKAAGVTPIRTTFMDLFFKDVLAGVLGIDAYYSYTRGGAPDEAALTQALDVFEDVVDNCLDPAVPVFGPLDKPLNAIMSDEAAILVAGEWIKGMVEQLGWTPGVDFGLIDPPGNAGLFVYTADGFSIPAGAPNLRGALSFLDTAISVAGQVAFCRFKGVTSVRRDVDLSDADSEKRFVIESMKNAKYRVTQTVIPALGSAIAAFVQTTPRDKEPLLQILLTTP